MIYLLIFPQTTEVISLQANIKTKTTYWVTKPSAPRALITTELVPTNPRQIHITKKSLRISTTDPRTTTPFSQNKAPPRCTYSTSPKLNHLEPRSTSTTRVSRVTSYRAVRGGATRKRARLGVVGRARGQGRAISSSSMRIRVVIKV